MKTLWKIIGTLAEIILFVWAISCVWSGYQGFTDPDTNWAKVATGFCVLIYLKIPSCSEKNVE